MGLASRDRGSFDLLQLHAAHGDLCKELGPWVYGWSRG